jgi:hypothetical protein
MVRFTPIFYIKLGDEGVTNVYIEESAGIWHNITNYEYYNVKKSLNEMSSFNVKFVDIKDEEKTWIKVNANILFTVGQSTILKGIIKKVKYSTKYECTVQGNGEEIKLLEKGLIKNSSAVCQYNNTSAQTIVKEILSEDSSGNAPYIINPATTGIFETDMGNISIKFENTNRLNALNSICDAIDYEWWLEHDDEDYDIIRIRVEEYRPSTTRAIESQGTFAITGVNQNCQSTDIEVDDTLLANDITFLGYGSGITQLKTRVYSASPEYSFLNVNCNSTENQITVEDGSSFSASGTILVGEEKVTYTSLFGDTFIGCVRGTDGTTARSHNSGCFVTKYVDINSPETGSSIAINGHLSDIISDSSVNSIEAAEVLVSKELKTRMSSVTNINVVPMEPITDCASYQIGDLITIVDEESSINSDYRIIEIEYNSEYGYLTSTFGCSNKSTTFTEKMQKERNRLDGLAQTNQGALNVWSDTQTQNTDGTHPLILRLNVPSSVVDSSTENKVNKIYLSYACKDYRTYSGELTGSTGDAYTDAGITNASAQTGAGITNVSSTTGAGITNASATTGASITNVSATTGASISNVSATTGAGITNAAAYTNADITNAVAGSSDSGYTTGAYGINPTIDGTWKSCSDDVDLGNYTYSFHTITANFSFSWATPTDTTIDGSVTVRILNTDTSEYFPDSYGVAIAACFDANLTGQVLSAGTTFIIPYNWTNDSYVLQYKISSAFDDDIYANYLEYSYAGVQGHTHSNSFNDDTHTNSNTFNDASHTNANTFSDASHTNANTFNDTSHTNANTFNDASHTNVNTFNDASHTNINSFDDAEHSNPAGTLASDYTLGEEASAATDASIKIYNSDDVLVWDSGARGVTEEENVDITDYVKTPDWYRVEIQPDGLAMVYGTVTINTGVSSI